MNLTVNELKTIMYKFNRVSELLLHTDFSDFDSNLKRFLQYIDDTELIKSYIDDMGKPSFDVAEEINRARTNDDVFNIGTLEKEEVANIYAILHYISDNNIQVQSLVFYGYSHGGLKWQEMVDAFNSRVVYLLISNIESFLTQKGYQLDMGNNSKNISNVFNGDINYLGLQQGDNNTMTNNIDIVKYDEIRSIVDEVMKYKNSFGAELGDLAEPFENKMDELIEAIDKKNEPSFLKKILNDAYGILLKAGEGILVAGLKAKLQMLLGM